MCIFCASLFFPGVLAITLCAITTPKKESDISGLRRHYAYEDTTPSLKRQLVMLLLIYYFENVQEQFWN